MHRLLTWKQIPKQFVVLQNDKMLASIEISLQELNGCHKTDLQIVMSCHFVCNKEPKWPTRKWAIAAEHEGWPYKALNAEHVVNFQGKVLLV